MQVKSKCKSENKKKSTQSAQSAACMVCSLHGLLFGVTQVEGGSPQNADHADCRPRRLCRLSAFFLILAFAFTFDLHIFGSGHKLVFNYILECLFMQMPRYLTLAWYVTVDIL